MRRDKREREEEGRERRRMTGRDEGRIDTRREERDVWIARG